MGDESDGFLVLVFVLFFFSLFLVSSGFMQRTGMHHDHEGLHSYFSSQLSGPT